MKQILLEPYRSAPYGARKQFTEMINLQKSIESGNNALALSLTRWTFGLQDMRIPTSRICASLNAVSELLNARQPDQRPRTVKELLALETQIESEMNPIQWEFAGDTQNGFIRRRLIDLVEKSIANLQDLLKSLLHEEAEDIRRSHRQ